MLADAAVVSEVAAAVAAEDSAAVVAAASVSALSLEHAVRDRAIVAAVTIASAGRFIKQLPP